tara:strand:- start:21 stop:2141 length:2121 start_codon:yes stop_codon:yes gene_type:complete
VDWSSIKKMNIKEHLLKIIDRLSNDDIIQYRFVNKTKYLETQNKEKKDTIIDNKYIWHEFRPPLEYYNIEPKNLKKYNIDSIKEEFKKTKKKSQKLISLLEEFREAEYILSLKYIEEIDELIMESDIVNPKYDPTPLDNSCCLQRINSNYNYYGFFSKQNTPLTKITELLNDYQDKRHMINTHLKDYNIIIKSNIIKPLQTFNIDIGADKDEITDKDIIQLFINYIDRGHFEGKKHMYENNICVLTGETKNSIMSKNFTQKDYYSLIQKINKTKLFSIDNSVYKIINEQLSFIINENDYLQQNNYLVKFNSSILKGKNMSALWDDFGDQINTEVIQIVDVLGKKLNLSDSDKDAIQNILLELGEKRKIMENDKEIMTNEIALNKFYTDKVTLLQSFIFTYLKNTIYKIKNNREIISPYVPEEWKISNRIDNIEDKYINIIQKHSDPYKKYFSIYESNKHIFEQIIEIINGTTNKLKLLQGNIITQNCTKSIRNNIYIYKNVGNILHYIFVYILYLILNINIDNTDNIEMENSEFILESTEYNLDEYDISRELKQTQEIEAQFILDIINSIGKDSKLLDKHTDKYVKQVIETKNESEKEANLKFIQELDKETWGSLKTMIKYGMDTWKSLSSKNRSLYIAGEVSGDTGAILTPEDTDANLRGRAQREMGDINDADFDEWKKQNDYNNDLNRQEYEERDILEDDDEYL